MAEPTPMTTTPEAPKTVEEAKNCASCKKPFKRPQRYYRNGKYFCNKNCWKKFQSSSQETAKETKESKPS